MTWLTAVDSAGEPEVRVVADPEAGARVVADLLATALRAAADLHGTAHFATTGGSTAPGMYRAFLEPEMRERLPWDRLQIWFGDDRFVPDGDPESNATPLDVILLRGVASLGLAAAPLPASAVHRIPVAAARAAGSGPDGAAAAYASELRRLVPGGPDGLPELDAMVLGVGPDGHCLSVFPGSEAFDVEPAAVVLGIPAPTHVEPHLPRVTMHPALVGEARTVVVSSFGAAKADLLARILEGPRDARRLPAQVARRPGATWVLDEAAASALSGR